MEKSLCPRPAALNPRGASSCVKEPRLGIPCSPGLQGVVLPWGTLPESSLRPRPCSHSVSFSCKAVECLGVPRGSRVALAHFPAPVSLLLFFGRKGRCGACEVQFVLGGSALSYPPDLFAVGEVMTWPLSMCRATPPSFLPSKYKFVCFFSRVSDTSELVMGVPPLAMKCCHVHGVIAFWGPLGCSELN